MPIVLCVFGMVLVGSSVSVSQLLLRYPLLTGQAARYAVAALALFAIAKAFPRFGAGASESRNPAAAVPRSSASARFAGTRTARSTGRPVPTVRELGVLAALAATGMAGFNACVLVALEHADPAVVGTVVGAAPLGLALLGPVLKGSRPTARIVAAAVVVVAGTALVQGTGRADGIGLLAAGGALVGEVAFTVLAAAVLPRLGAVRVAAWSCALAVALLLVGALATGEASRWRMPTGTEFGALAYLAALMTVGAFLAWFAGLQRLGVERAGMIVGIMPVATLATAAVMAGTLPAPGQAAGVLTVAVGLALGLTAVPNPRDHGVPDVAMSDQGRLDHEQWRAEAQRGQAHRAERRSAARTASA
ncbi:MAG TPA: DMT family transporter [Asanoa sp.]